MGPGRPCLVFGYDAAQTRPRLTWRPRRACEHGTVCMTFPPPAPRQASNAKVHQRSGHRKRLRDAVTAKKTFVAERPR